MYPFTPMAQSEYNEAPSNGQPGQARSTIGKSQRDPLLETFTNHAYAVAAYRQLDSLRSLPSRLRWHTSNCHVRCLRLTHHRLHTHACFSQRSMVSPRRPHRRCLHRGHMPGPIQPLLPGQTSPAFRGRHAANLELSGGRTRIKGRYTLYASRSPSAVQIGRAHV